MTGHHRRYHLGRYDTKTVSFRDNFFSSLDLALLLDDVGWTDWSSFAGLMRIT